MLNLLGIIATILLLFIYMYIIVLAIDKYLKLFNFLLKKTPFSTIFSTALFYFINILAIFLGGP
jgi:hypothetical protein